MFDLFYTGKNKPNLFPFEQQVSGVKEAALLSKTKFFWLVDSRNDYTDFDFSWRPVPWEEHQIHVWPSQWQSNGGTYFVNKYTATTSVKNYKTDIVKRNICLQDWVIPDDIDTSCFDFSWHPNHDDPEPYRYVFGTQWQKSGGPEFIVEGAILCKYVTEQRVSKLPCKDNWEVPENIDEEHFDFTWHPDATDPVYIYQFGTQWQQIGGPRYIPKDATEDTPVKYLDAVKGRTKPDRTLWHFDETKIDAKAFDFSWVPHPEDPPYIYQFGTQWQRTGGPRYVVPGATEIKYVKDIKAKRFASKENWVLDEEISYANFDFSWHPDDSQREFKHIIGTQWQRTSETYYYEGTEEDPPVNFVNDIRITYPSNKLPRYYIESTLEDLIHAHPKERFWALSKDMKYDNFDFSWHPDHSQLGYQHVFGSNWQKHGQTYLINSPAWLAGNTNLNYVSDQKTDANASLDIFFIDKYNARSAERFAEIQSRYPQAQKTRYMNGMLQTAMRCAAKAKTDKFWIVSSDCVYDKFDFSWHCEPWQNHMTQVFGSQWQKWSDTLLISKWELERNSKWCKDIKDFPNLNFVSDQKVTLPDDASELWYVEHYNDESEAQLEQLRDKHSHIKEIRFVDSYLETFKRIVEKTDSEYIWIASSICDYANFDFSWRPEVWQDDMLHVFASGSQKCGDTFFVKTQLLKNQLKNLQKLEDFNVVNYTNQQDVYRFDVEIVGYTSDTLVDAVKEHKFKSRYAFFRPSSSKEEDMFIPSLWASHDRSVHLLNDSGSHALVPKDAQIKVSNQIYDYPYITRVKDMFAVDHPLDIVFLSNGEPMAEEMWEHLLESTEGMPNKIHRVDNVNGRAEAYKACASVSETPWFFNVFAKLQMRKDFNWLWQPDRLQASKHYIFHAHNPLTNMSYGHMGMIAYNKKLVLSTTDIGLDFTLSAEHEVVDILSGEAKFDYDPLVAWRTSFREVIKLKHYAKADPSAMMRIAAWKNIDVAKSKNAPWALKGVNDALAYYNEVNGELDKLMLTFEWKWLNEYFNQRHKI